LSEKPPASLYNRQPPVPAQALLLDAGAEWAVAKVENFCSAPVELHLGQAGAGWLLLRISFSKTWPQWGHTYSNIGISK